MARASTYTLLSLDRYAELVGINPVHFNGASGPKYWPHTAVCDTHWYQHGWQDEGMTSREELAQTIKQCEDEIAEYLGYYPAPVFIEEEAHPWPRASRSYGRASTMVGGSYGSVRYGLGATQFTLNYAHLVGMGRRKIDNKASQVPVTLEDEDGDGFKEIAKIEEIVALTPEELDNLKVYAPERGLEPSYEIRPLLSIDYDDGTETLTIRAWSWLFFKDQAITGVPTADEGEILPINAEDESNYMDEVDIGTEIVDGTQPSAQFRYLPGSACGPLCVRTLQDGCATEVERKYSMVIPTPAEFIQENGDTIVQPSSLACGCTIPSEVAFWYKAGDRSAVFKHGGGRDPLSDFWAVTIKDFATARLQKPLCGCGNTMTFYQDMSIDLAELGDRERMAHIMSNEELNNPFGTKRGEVKAYRRINRLRGKMGHGFAV